MALVYKTNTVALNSTSNKIEELCSPVKLQSKEVDVLLSDVKTEVKPDEGFDGMYEVVVNHSPVESNTPFKATSNGEYTIHPSDGFDATTGVNLSVEVPLYCYWYLPQTYSIAKLNEIKSFYNKLNLGVSNLLGYCRNIVQGQAKATTDLLLWASKEPVDFTFSVAEVAVQLLTDLSDVSIDTTAKTISDFYLDNTTYHYATGWRRDDNDTIFPSPESIQIATQNKTQSITENGSYTITSDSGNLLKSVVVNVNIDNVLILPDGTKFADSSFADEPPLDRLNFSEITNFDGCFRDVLGLHTFYGDTASGTSFASCFSGCEDLASIDQMDTSSAELLDYCFNGCYSLVSINADLDCTNVTSALDCFAGCTALETLDGLTGLKIDLDLSATALGEESLVNIFNSIADVTSSPKTLTLGTTLLAKLTEEDKKIATDKGWKLA